MTEDDMKLADDILRPLGPNGLSDIPAALTASERWLLFSLALASTGDYLEIGSLHGGSAMIAYKASGYSRRLVLIDPEEAVAILPEIKNAIADRTDHIHKRSPDALAALTERQFGLVFIDGDHARAAVAADARAAWPLVASGGALLFHDSYNPEVWAGITDFLADSPAGIDGHCQLPGGPHYQDGQKWGGLYLIRKRS